MHFHYHYCYNFNFQFVYGGFTLIIVVPVLFQHSLKETGNDHNYNKVVGDMSHIFGVEPMKLTSPSTDDEIALALRVLEGCCLLHPHSTTLAHQHNAVQVIFLFFYSIYLSAFIITDRITS